MNRKTLAAALIFVATLPAHAAPISTSSTGLSLASALGQWLAEQGNEALREMRKDFAKDLEQRLKPMLPQPSQPAEIEPKPSEALS
ncbi:MAG: hypothetical protein ACT4QA_10530 [Panacagrimonas sp.]